MLDDISGALLSPTSIRQMLEQPVDVEDESVGRQ